MALLILVQDFNEQDAFYEKNYTMKPCTVRSSFILYKISASKKHFCEKLIAFDAPGATWVKNLKNLEKLKPCTAALRQGCSRTHLGERAETLYSV